MNILPIVAIGLSLPLNSWKICNRWSEETIRLPRLVATAVSELPETNSFTLYFSFDKTAINVASHQAIDQVVKAYRSGVPVTISLAGHTDRADPQPYNFKLSHRRAEAVRKMLIEKGVPVQMITTQAFGEGRPHISTADGVRDEKNRRVEIIVDPASSL